jgi:hypothetical protein
MRRRVPLKVARADAAMGPKNKVQPQRQTLLMVNTKSPLLTVDQPAQLNLYGDVKLSSHTKFGQDIASQRFDELDRSCTRFALNLLDKGRKVNRAVDLGSGKGIQGVRLGLMGFETVIYDIEPMPNLIEEVRKLYPLCKIKKIRTDLQNIKPEFFPQAIDICYSQRFIHYLRFNDAVLLLKKVFANMRSGGRLFISASGLHSEIGRAHPQHDLPASERYARIEPAMAEKHDIYAPICPYSETELVELCRTSGFALIAADTSEFGNVKAIFERSSNRK